MKRERRNLKKVKISKKTRDETEIKEETKTTSTTNKKEAKPKKPDFKPVHFTLWRKRKRERKNEK